jgi:hypothetical protein
MTGRWGRFSRVTYNSLPSVEHADLQRRSSAAFTPLLEEVGTILQQFSMEEMFGLYLVHGHFYLNQQERMVETFDEDRRALVTKPIVLPHGLRAAPSRWALKNSGLVPLEFSTDRGASTAFEALSSEPKFFTALTAAIRDYDLTDTIGVASIRRDCLVANQEEVFLEENYGQVRESVIHLCKATDLKEGDYIPTVWASEGGPQTQCRPTWHCVPAGEAHHKHFEHPKW